METQPLKQYVEGFAFNYDRDSVVLIRKKRPAWQAGYLNGVGGKIEPNELTIEAMVREYREETGVNNSPADWQHTITLKTKDSEIFFFRSFNRHLYELALTKTDERVERVYVGELAEYNIVPNLHYIIPMCLFADSNYNNATLVLPVTLEER
jgi:8-oxo-dGTP diphosphatase